MSQAKDINIGKGGGIAPTPQNTPAAHATQSVLSRPQIPSTLQEVEEDSTPTISSQQVAAANAALAHPAFSSLVQSRLDSLVGRSSGYIESLGAPILRRLTGLKGLQADHAKLEAEFQKEILELEKRWAEKYKPLYERRRELVTGVSEPSKEELTKGEEAEKEEFEEDSDDDEPVVQKAEPTATEIAACPNGIPEFWLTALKNHLGISELITEKDEEALKHLIDISVSYLDGKPGFKLTFKFSKGAKTFFQQEELVKTYYYQDEVGYQGDFVYDHAEGTNIKWVDGKDLTTKTETKKQRNKNTNQTRIVKKVVPTDSFFTFFKPPVPPLEDDDEDAEADDNIDERLEMDYQIGEDLKERIVPKAVDYFTGKALREDAAEAEEFDSDEFTEEEEDNDNDDDNDDDDDDDDGIAPAEKKGGVKKAPAPPSGVTPASNQDPQECKQQ